MSKGNEVLNILSDSDLAQIAGAGIYSAAKHIIGSVLDTLRGRVKRIEKNSYKYKWYTMANDAWKHSNSAKKQDREVGCSMAEIFFNNDHLAQYKSKISWMKDANKASQYKWIE